MYRPSPIDKSTMKCMNQTTQKIMEISTEVSLESKSKLTGIDKISENNVEWKVFKKNCMI